MLKATDLRIGNYIKLKSGSETIIRGGGINAIEMLQLEVFPVELTDEWFMKFGFVKELFSFHINNCTPNYFCLWDNKNGFIFNDWHGHIGVFIKYVHQLQNLYFALTGNELTLINPKA